MGVCVRRTARVEPSQHGSILEDRAMLEEKKICAQCMSKELKVGSRLGTEVPLTLPLALVRGGTAAMALSD